MYAVPSIFASVFLAIIYWGLYAGRSPSWYKTLTKGGATFLLVIASTAIFVPWLTIGLFLSFLGDVFLSRDGQRNFLGGVASFAAAHVAFIVLFAVDGNAAVGHLGVPLRAGLAVMLALLTVIMARLLWRNAGDLRVPVVIYALIILTMGLTALAIPPNTAATAAMKGALLFVASDAILAAEMFLLADGTQARCIAPYLVWPLYYIAQLLFVVAFVGVYLA